MLAQMYSTKEFPRSIRTTFEIPEDPYSDDPAKKQRAVNFLQSLGVFFYRDETNIKGVVIDDGGEEPIEDRRGFKAYKILVNLDSDLFRVLPWEKPTRAKIEKEGDDKAWLFFNERVIVLRVTEDVVRMVQ